MSEHERPERKSGKIIYNVIVVLVLGGCVYLTQWTALACIELGKTMSGLSERVGENVSRLDNIESRGSSGLQAHVDMDNARVLDIKARLDKLENAVFILQSTPGELKAINVQLENLREGQNRIEKSVSK